MKNIKKLTFVAIAALYSTVSIADNETNLGTTELSVYGNITSGDNTSAFFNMTYGQYMSPNLLWSVGIGAFGSDAGGGSISFSGSTGVTYHFNDIGSTAYVKSNFYIFDLENGGDTASLEGYYGYKNYVNDRTAVFYEIGYRQYIDSDYSGGQVVGNLGITYLF